MRLKSHFGGPIFTRFDFGVPLEDVFPTGQLHPRLKHLLAKALEAYRAQETSIEFVLRYGQGSLEECLGLKNQLVLAPNSELEDSSPGAYLWVLRHFLGLLPLPLFPSFTMDTHFDWLQLANECRTVLKDHHQPARGTLDQEIARVLNALPKENLRLIKLLMQLMRKLSRLSRASLRALCHYFSGSLFVRPFRPGLDRQDRFQPLLLYLIVRWNKIALYCPVADEESWHSPLLMAGLGSISCPVAFCGKNLKEVGCQTLSNGNEEEGLPVIDLGEPEKLSEPYRLAFVEEEEDCAEGLDANDTSPFCTAQDVLFRSTLDEEKAQNWPNIVQETMRTVQKVEESYIYDDYESFNREDFNQIGNKPGNLLTRFALVKASTPKAQSSDSDNSYIKFPDVCENFDENAGPLKVTDQHEGKTVGQILFENDSPADVQEADSHEGLRTAKKKHGELFRRISVHLFRTLNPTRRVFERKLKYMKICTDKSSTSL